MITSQAEMVAIIECEAYGKSWIFGAVTVVAAGYLEQ